MKVHHDCPKENLPGYARNLAFSIYMFVEEAGMNEPELRDVVSTLEEAWAVTMEAVKRQKTVENPQ